MTTALSSPAPYVSPTVQGSEAAPGTEEERLTFWEAAALRLDWEDVPGQDKPWHTTHRRVPADVGAGIGPDITWFDGGKLNVAYNCVDRHVAAGRGDKVALHFEGEPGDRRTITYAELQREVSKAANALLDLGIAKGDRVVIYLPVIPETVIITLAVAPRWRHPLARLRRFLRGGTQVPGGGHPRQAAGHHRRAVPPRHRRAGQGQRGCGRRRGQRRRARAGGQPHHRTGTPGHRPDDRGPRRVVA